MTSDSKIVDMSAHHTRTNHTDHLSDVDDTTFLLKEGLPLLTAFRVIAPETRASLFQLIQKIARKDTHLAS